MYCQNVTISIKRAKKGNFSPKYGLSSIGYISEMDCQNFVKFGMLMEMSNAHVCALSDFHNFNAILGRIRQFFLQILAFFVYNWLYIQCNLSYAPDIVQIDEYLSYYSSTEKKFPILAKISHFSSHFGLFFIYLPITRIWLGRFWQNLASLCKRTIS